MIIKVGDFADPLVMDLLEIHLSGMHQNSPPESVYALDYSGLQESDVAFWTISDGPHVMGCGALKELSLTQGEIKSMRTHPDYLRKGVAAKMLEHILSVANSRAYKKLSLETGSGPAFDPALELYKKYGFKNGDAFGDYEKSKFNQFMHLEIS